MVCQKKNWQIFVNLAVGTGNCGKLRILELKPSELFLPILAAKEN